MLPREAYGRVVAKTAGLSVALDERDPVTQAHCDRVSGLCIELGEQCGLSTRELDLLRLAAGLHDIGKIGIPDGVLKKPGPLDDSDWVVMKTHSVRSERIVLAADMEDGPTIALAVRHHHERFDGHGYPDGLSGEAIPLLARIVAVVDAYDAMARMRSYGDNRTHHQIMNELRDCQGAQHDPYLITRFALLIEHSRFKAES